jgi:hypothetical protein
MEEIGCDTTFFIFGASNKWTAVLAFIISQRYVSKKHANKESHDSLPGPGTALKLRHHRVVSQTRWTSSSTASYLPDCGIDSIANLGIWTHYLVCRDFRSFVKLKNSSNTFRRAAQHRWLKCKYRVFPGSAAAANVLFLYQAPRTHNLGETSKWPAPVKYSAAMRRSVGTRVRSALPVIKIPEKAPALLCRQRPDGP